MNYGNINNNKNKNTIVLTVCCCGILNGKYSHTLYRLLVLFIVNTLFKYLK